MTRNSALKTSLLVFLLTIFPTGCYSLPPGSSTPAPLHSGSNLALYSTTPPQPTSPPTSSPSPSPTRTQLFPTATRTPARQPSSTIPEPSLYYAQSGDSLPVVVKHFGISPADITSPDLLSGQGLLTPGQVLQLPPGYPALTPSERLLPDSELVFSPSAAEFDVAAYLEKTNGFLKTHREYLKSTGWTSAADILTRIAFENSINPRILLSLLEYNCHCVLGPLDQDVSIDFLLGNTDFRRKGLYRQLGWAASRLSIGYYGWRGGTLGEFSTPAGRSVHPPGDSNAASVAIQYFFAFYPQPQAYTQGVDPQSGLSAVHASLFGDPWERAATVEPLFPAGLVQPGFILPFEPGRLWSFTSGPHSVWETEGAQAALDFAPATYASGCIQTDAWAVALADGTVVRTEYGAVIQDLDAPDGTPADRLEQTGWVILYMHIESRDQVAAGTHLKAGDRIGHPSCEGGRATGTHLHLARKYNGEWVLAVGALPFDLEGWIAYPGDEPYQGTLQRRGQVVIAHPYGSFETKIIRPTLTPTANGN
jgi:LasA protease